MKIIIPWHEIELSAIRSSGAGGQHVNKTNSAVQLRFSIPNSNSLTDLEKQRLLEKLSHRITTEGEIIVRSEQERDQKTNKETAFLNLNRLIISALQLPKKRVATKPKKSSVKKRLESKKKHSEAKKLRRKVF